MPKFRKRPIIVEAERIIEPIIIHTFEGDMLGNPGDWLVTGITGEKYPVKHKIFIETYEAVED